MLKNIRFIRVFYYFFKEKYFFTHSIQCTENVELTTQENGETIKPRNQAF